jgi:hypothetical protein
MDRKTLEQNYQKSFGASPAAELEQNYQRSGIDSLVQSVKKATQYNPSAPSTQPTQAAPAGASSRKQSDAMKEQLDAIKKQRDDAAIKAGAYMRAGNMPQQAKEQQEIANKAAIEYENAYTQWKNQRNAEAVEDYNPDENKFKAGDAILSGVQNAFQSMRQYAAAASSYLSGNPEAQAWEAKRLMESGVSGTEAVKRAGLADKREIPITDYKTQAELRHEKNVASVGAVEGGALQLVNTISNMVPSLVANAILPGSGLPVMAASAAGNKYADAYEKYGNTDTAFVLGSAAGGASMLTEQFGGLYGSLGKSAAGQAVAKKLMAESPGLYNLANSVGGKWLRDALSEGIEEGAEDVINYAIEKALTGDSDEMDNFGYDMLLGALAGGVFGGGNAAMRSVTYSRVGKALNASPAAVAQQVQEGMEKGAGTAPAIYAAEVQKNPSNQMVGRLYEANLTYDAESGLSKIQNDITQVSINEIKAMVSKADALAQAAQKLNVEATPQAVATAITDAQRTQSIKTAEDSVGQAFAPTVDNPANAGEKAYNSALAGVAANQGVAARINNDPAARQAFSQLTGVQFSGNTAQDIAAIEVATQNIAKSGKQAISQAEYAQRVAAAGKQAAAQFDVDMQAQAEQMQRESEERWLSVEQNTITDVDGKRRIKEITNTDVRGNTEIGYKKAEIPGSKKKTVAEVNNAAKYLGKTIVWFEGAVQVNGQYRLTNGYRAPDGTIYVNINSRDPLMVTFGHEMFHDLVADSKYSGMIDTLVENPDYADMVKGMMNAKTELYERNGIELDPNAAAEEVAADISGDLLGSRDMLEYIGARNTEAATGIKGFLNRILKKLKGKPSAQEAYNRLSEAQRALIDGMEDGARNTFVDPAIGEDVKYSIREEAPPEKTILGYKVFVVKDGKLYPPMVANPNAADTPVGVWLNADIGERAPDSKTGRMQVKAGGKGTQGGSGSLAFRPGWHLGEVPVASQFDRLNPETGKKELFPSNFVWAECLVAADIDYQEEAMSYGYTKSGKFQHSLAGLPKLPVDGYYKYRTNPRPDTVPWLITGAMKVNRILSDNDVAQILKSKGITPPKRQGGEKTLEQLGLGKYAGEKHSLMDGSNTIIVGDGDVDALLPKGYEDIGVAITGEDSAAPNRYSLMSFGESDLGTDRFKYATRLAKATGVSVQQATDWIDSVYSVAAIIGDDKTRLDYEANRNNTSLKPNSEYDFSLDFSTLCAKRLLFSGTMDAIQSALPNTPLTSEDFVHLREIMKDSGYEVACGICYVESTRREFSTISEGFVEQYRKAQAEGTNIKKVNAAGQTKDLTTSKGIENNDPNRFVYPEKGFTPTLADLVTAEGIDRLQAEHPEVYKAFNAYMNARGQQKPKMIETRTDYRGEILNLTKGQVSRRNSHGGLRIQSFSDFEVPHLIDMMQAVYDMASMGLKGQAYTKVPSFARAMGRTGIKINLSLIAKGDGLDANGKLIFDDVEGMPASEAFSIRNDPRFSENVGTILVGKNVKHIVTAMADPEIDFIIPFHKSSWSASLYKSLGLEGYEDFTDYQNEKKAGTKIENYDPAEYWDFSKTGDENAQIYLEKCRADGRTPKFAEVMYEGKSLTEYPGYWKLLIDYKMYNNDGVGAPQQAVKPVFDDAYNAKMLSEYKGGHGKLPVAHDIVDRFLKEKSEGSYSLMDTDSDGRELSAEQREYFFGSKVVDADGRLKPVYHGSPAVFTEFSTDFMSQHGSSEGQGFYFTDYKPMAEGYQKDGGQLLEGYLDIKKPLSDSEITLTRAEVKKLLQAVDPTGDEVLVNYDPAGGIGYPSKTWYNRAMDATVKAAMEYSDSDSEILAEIANGGAGTGAVLEAARNTLGYDGYIVEGKYDNATVYVAFDSSQFKNIDNTAPTESKDIRYSLMKDAQYMADIDRVVSEATEKANDELKAAQAEVKDIRQQLADYRQQATAEAKMNDRWRDAETKLLTEIAAAKEREKAAKARAEFMAKYDALSKQYRADLRANNRQVRDKYNEKLSEAKDEFNRRRAQDRIDRVVREDRAKSKARLRTAEQKSTTTEDVAKVLTEMPKKDKETFKAKAAKDWRTFKRQWINTKDELERFGNEVGDSRIMYAANNVGQASAAAQYSIGGAGQYDLNGKKIGDKNLMQVFEPAKKAGLTDEFYAYLLHEHNVDRMSVRENAQRQLAELRAKLNKEVNGFAEMTDENIATAAGKDTTLTKAYTEAQIAAAKQYKQFQAWAEKQFDKPVFGSSVTADDSRAAAADLLDAHPEFEKWAKDVYAYLDGLMEVRKQGGLVSADMAQYMKELYPHYVPTYRDMASTSGGYSNPNSVAVNSTIKSAKGGNQDIMPLIDSIARQTLQSFSAAKKNILGNMLYEDAMDTTRDISEYIQSVTEEGDLVDLDADSAENLKNTLRIWVDGKPVTLHMSEAMADGFRPIEQSNSFGMKALRSINSTFKKLVTQWNPVFIVRNFVRDAQSALYFTHYSNATFVKNYGKAVKEIATNGKYWQLYQAMGGKGTTYYDPKTGLSDRYHFKNGAVDKVAGGLNRVIDILSFANEAVEQYPRLAEFISTMEDTGDVQQALYNAADITTNFGRGGFAARKLNASLVPFFNPGMQGLSKNIRNVIDRRGWKEIGQLISRLLINGVAPGIIMGLLYDGLKEDDDYKELSNYIKDSNILIKIGDNKFIKIPMGREPSVITAFTNRMWRWLKGEPASSAFAGYPSFAIEQIAPNNPLTNNIFAGITAMSTNKTWYGGDIVSSYMEEKPDYLQYDESTDAFSIWLGEITRHGKNGIEGLSPKKVNYLIDQYSGFIGDWLLPALSKKADVPAVVKAFVVDSVRQNRLGSDFYDALDEAKQVKETEFATAADDATYSYLYKQSKAASEITKQLKEIYNSGEKTRKEKREEARDLLELRNEIYRKALLTVGTYEETAKSIGSADSDVVKREANRKAFGAEYALKTYNKDVGEKAAEYVAQGVTYDQYYAAYFAARGITGDKDENGKTITNSASRKKKEAIDKSVPGASTKQKHLLYEALGVSEKVW